MTATPPAPLSDEELDKFPIGTWVRKIKGYKFEGRSLGTFRYFTAGSNGALVGDPKFVNVQHADGWVMHFREHELEAFEPATPAPQVEEAELAVAIKPACNWRDSPKHISSFLLARFNVSRKEST